jgi:hypothetical protein
MREWCRTCGARLRGDDRLGDGTVECRRCGDVQTADRFAAAKRSLVGGGRR